VNYLVDTNIASEPTKPRPNPQVLSWVKAHLGKFYISSISIAEIRRGIERLPAGRKKDAFELWFAEFCRNVGKRILSFNASTAHVYGQLTAKWERNGITVPDLDGLIAATAHRHNLAVVTRNISDFQKAGVRVINPFGDSDSE